MPRLSVVVVSFNAPALLAQCVSAIAAQSRPSEVEIVVVADATRAEALDALTPRFPSVRIVRAPASSTVPRMRVLAIEQCRGDIVALLEDDCVVEPGWCDAISAAHRGDEVAVGGAVEPGPYRRGLDWAVYFCEYGRFMLPLRPQPEIALALAGNHVSYKRHVVQRALPDLAGGFYDLFVHTTWAAARLPMRAEQNLVLRNLNSWSLRHVTTVPYHHGRAYAGQRFAGQPAWRRAGIGCLALALPVVKVGRVVRDVVARRRYAGRLLQALPWIVVFMTSWSVGEAIGCVGGPGTSASKWR